VKIGKFLEILYRKNPSLRYSVSDIKRSIRTPKEGYPE
jgi:hypothetical protein